MNYVNHVLALILFGFTSISNANLIFNGGFEVSTSPLSTPIRWENIGHEEGVVTYNQVGLPAYEGLNFYDVGGFHILGSPGDGITQSFETIIGVTYDVFFGLSSENEPTNRTETLTVTAGDASVNYILMASNEGPFRKAFTTQSFSFIALNALTALTFIDSGGDSGGRNDPIIDDVIVVVKVINPGLNEVPLPGAVWLFGSALLGFAGFGRKKSI